MTSNNQRPPRLSNGTPVHVRGDHFAEECEAVVADADYDEGWLYRIDVTAGDRLEEQRNQCGQLWVCAFEVQPIAAREA